MTEYRYDSYREAYRRVAVKPVRRNKRDVPAVRKQRRSIVPPLYPVTIPGNIVQVRRHSSLSLSTHHRHQCRHP